MPDPLAPPVTARLDALLRAISGGVVLVSSDGRITEASDSFTSMVGRNRDLLAGSEISTLLPSESIRRAHLGPVEEMLRRFEGPPILVRITAATVPPEAQVDSPAGLRPGEVVLYVEDWREHARAMARAEWLADHDSLTGALNRQATTTHLEELVSAPEQGEGRTGVILIDIDAFQQVNDRLGHSTGDAVLRTVAQRLGTTHHDCVVGRLGADEFVVITNCADVHHPEELASSILTALNEPIIVGADRVHLRATVGVAVLGEAGRTAEELLQQADIALHGAKKGSWPIGIADQDTAQQARQRLHRDEHIAHLIRSHELSLAYQPLPDRSGHVRAVEALIRADGASAGEIVQTAERHGLVDVLGGFVIAQGCSDLPAIQRAAGERVTLHINVAADQLVGDRLVPQLLQAVAANGLPPGDVCVEVTEQTALTDLTAIERLSTAGFSVSIDDFGTGYSSFSYLRDLPFDQVKIDMSFVHRATEDKAARLVLDGMIGLCRGLGLEVVCEGVETAEQREIVLTAGADAWQGYLRVAPAPLDELLTVLTEWETEDPMTTLQTQLARLGMQDLLVFSRIGDRRYAHIGGEGRGEGWAGIVEIDLATEPFMADQLSRRTRVSIGVADAVQLLGPYHACSAVVVRRDEDDALVVIGNQHELVPVSADDPRVDEIVDLAIAHITHVSPAKPLADELEIREAVQALLQWDGDGLDEALQHLLDVAVAALSCDVGVAYLPGTGTVITGVDNELVAAGLKGWRGADALSATLPDCVQQAGREELPEGWVDELEIRSWYGMPLRGGAGALIVAHTAERPRGFTQLCQRLGMTLVESAERLFDSAATREELRTQVSEARQAARTDELTGCGNRLAWEEALATAERGDHGHLVGIADLNGFTSLNEDQGHPAGDRALTRTARAIQMTVQQIAGRADGHPPVVARVGADEFAFLACADDPEVLTEFSAMWTDMRPAEVSLEVGVAHAATGADARAAFEAAEGQMLERKDRPGPDTRHLRAVE